MICFPNAKINIGLRVLKKRNDGYHDIESVIYPLKGKIYDALEIIIGSEPGVRSSGLSISVEEKNNLCVKAYELLKKDFNIPPVTIYLHKAIPAGSGLGGGSADGAFMLKLLNEEFKLKLSEKKMMHYAGKLGSDCSFFIRNEPALAHGRGEIIKGINETGGIKKIKGKRIEVVYSDIHISTADAYSLVKPKQTETSLEKLILLPLEDWKDKIVNDFEEPIFSKYPQLKKVKEELYRMGALYASMSGSGSAVYGIFQN